MLAAATEVVACAASVSVTLATVQPCVGCWQDGSGRVDLESLKDGELDYGCDQAGLAELRQRTRTAVHNYEGAPACALDNSRKQQCQVAVHFRWKGYCI